MNAARALCLLLVFGCQLLADGGALLRVCRTGDTAMRNCPCAEQARAERAAHPGAAFDRASCCALERGATQQAPVAVATFHADSVELPALVPVRMPRLNATAVVASLAPRDGPRSQGPPVFIKVRSLLI